MPAGSDADPAPLPALPRTWRPLGPRVAGTVGGLALVVVIGVMWVTFPQATRDAVTPLQIGTVIFLFGIGYAALYALIRSRVRAEADRLVVVNGYRRRELDWAEVVAVRLPPGAPWVTLDLADGTTLSAMGIQGSDGARAQRAVRDLRALVGRAERP